MKFLLASQNAHKAKEFAAAVSSLHIVPTPAPIEVDENASTFVGNAALKARAYAEFFQQNALADDSGLSVEALDGKPGVYSARFATMPPDVDDDPDRTAANNRKLLKYLKDIPEARRTAFFTCALCLVIVMPEDIEIVKTLKDPHIAYFDRHLQRVSRQNDEITRVEITIEARAYGRILDQAHGKGGFGYDPLFFCPETNCTFADLTQEQKLSVSHRGRAIAQLKEIFKSL